MRSAITTTAWLHGGELIIARKLCKLAEGLALNRLTTMGNQWEHRQRCSNPAMAVLAHTERWGPSTHDRPMHGWSLCARYSSMPW